MEGKWILCMQKEKLVIFTLSRQQKITPNCKWGGGCGGREARQQWLLGYREASFQEGFLHVHMCECRPPGTANGGFALFKQQGEHGPLLLIS